ncbi:MAG TPA: phage major capsid protein [Nitrospira sp.]|nr:phage major capsid protein [Nitrospira sp.]
MSYLDRAAVVRARNLLDGAIPSVSRDVEATALAGYLGLSRRDLERYSLLRAIALRRESIMKTAGSLHMGDARFTGHEADCHYELVKRFGEPLHQGTILVPADAIYRDLQAVNASAGGYLAGTKNVSFVDRLRNTSISYRLGAQAMPGQRENITIPRGNGGSTGTWLSTETSQAVESTPTFLQIASSPKTCSAYSEISQRLLQQGGPAGEAIITGVIADDLAVTVDGAVISGTGASGQPTGILNTSGIGTVPGFSLGYAGLLAAQKTVADANSIVNVGAVGYATTPAVSELLKGRQRFSGADSPLWRGALHDGEVEGVRAIASKQIPSATLLYGDWSTLLIPEWGVLAIEVNPFADFKSAVVGIRALWAVDVIVQNPTSFVAITSIS